MATLFIEFANLCKKLEETTSTLEKRRLISNFLRKLEPDEWKPFILLLTGKIIPESNNKALYIGYSTLKKALATKVKPLFSLGPLTIKEVFEELNRIASFSGVNVFNKRIETLASLLSRMNDLEKKFLLRAISGEMRIGVVTGLVIHALADTINVDVEKLRKAYLLIGDIGEIADKIAKGQLDLENIIPILFNPIKPMLASSANTIEEAMHSIGGKVAIEAKYDGVRVQIHYSGNKVKVFSRRLTDVTNNLPEIVDIIKRKIHVNDVILEGEVIAVDEKGNPKPFQDLMKRFKRVKDFNIIIRKIPIKLYLFDILYLNGKLLIDEPYYKRYEYLTTVVPRELLAERIVTDNIETAKIFYNKCIQMGHEGIMIKKLDSPYVMGVRGAYWIKIKEVETIDVVIVGAEWGHGRRKGWLSDYYLAVYDPDNDEFLIVGKTFKGLTDEEFTWMTNKLLELKISDEEYRIWVKPEIVVEVAFNEVQKSPKYKSGFALRFARITRFRLDKSPKDVTTIDELKEIYQREIMRKKLS